MSKEYNSMSFEVTNSPAIPVGFKKMHPMAVLPEYAHDSDSGMDVRSVESASIPPRSFRLFDTGLAPDLPQGFEIQVRPRSGMQCKKGIVAGWGTVDAGYHGSIGIVLYNHTDTEYKVEVGDRIAQLVVAPVVKAQIHEVSEFGSSDRGADGFGSTGIK